MAKKKKFGKKKVIIGAIIAAIVAAFGISFFMRARRMQAVAEAAAVSTVQSATAETATITNTVTGSGTLTNDDAEDITIPTGITIDKVLVEEGDTVKTGDALATVDRTSVETAISDIQDSLSSIDEQLADIDEDSTTETIEATVSGRVKKIYAETDDEVGDILKENEALMLISADGLMAVDLTNTGTASQGDAVTVTLSDGTERDGTVANASGDTVTVTITDDGPEVGDTVSVKDPESGAALGSGTLYIHQILKVTAVSGTVSRIYVSENEAVDQGDDLIYLKNVQDTTERDRLLSEREDLTEALSDMLELEESCEILSTYDGTIQSVNVEEDTEVTKTTTASSGTTAASASGFSSTSSTAASSAGTRTLARLTPSEGNSSAHGGITLLSDSADGEEMTAEAAAPLETITKQSQNESGDNDDDNDSDDNDPNDDNKKDAQTGAAPTPGETRASITTVDIPVAIPSEGDSPLSADALLSALNKAYESLGYSAESASWDTGEEHFSAANSPYILNVVLKTDADHVFGDVTVRIPDGTTLTYSSFSESNTKLKLQVSYPIAAATSAADGTAVSDTPAVTETPSVTEGASASGNAAGAYSTTTPSASTGGISLSGGSSSVTGSTGSISGSTSGSASASSTSTDLYSSYETVGFTVTTDEYMKVSISVDELDILSISEGENADITLDAIDGETFTGTVDSINTTGSNSGGSSKFTVVIKVPKDDRMLVGMSATATITISAAEDVLTIPVGAVQERGSEKYVYTEQDDEGNLTGEVTIETGTSNDTIVEVTSGLEEGQTVYYDVLNGTTIENEDAQSFAFGNFGGGGNGGGNGGGDMPAGGMPGGGGPGGN